MDVNQEIIIHPKEYSIFHGSHRNQGVIPQEILDSLWPESAQCVQKLLDSCQQQNTLYTTRKFDISSLNEKVSKYIQTQWNQKYRGFYYNYQLDILDTKKWNYLLFYYS